MLCYLSFRIHARKPQRTEQPGCGRHPALERAAEGSATIPVTFLDVGLQWQRSRGPLASDGGP